MDVFAEGMCAAREGLGWESWFGRGETWRPRLSRVAGRMGYACGEGHGLRVGKRSTLSCVDGGSVLKGWLLALNKD